MTRPPDPTDQANPDLTRTTRPASPDARPVRGPWIFAVTFWTVFIARAADRFEGTWVYPLFDDAMISMRYARHAADGHGLVWNVGEPGVEGYTNFGWTLWMTALHAIGLPPSAVAFAVALTGLGLLLATMLVVRSVARHISQDDRRVVVGALWLVATAYPLAFWTLRGMEVGVVAFVLAATVHQLLTFDEAPGRRTLSIGALVAIGVLTRTDTAALLVVIGVAHLVASRPAHIRRIAAVVVGLPVAVVVAHAALRWQWYGELVPITYTLKVEGTDLGERLGRGSLVAVITTGSGLVVACVGAVAALARSAVGERRTAVTLVSPFVAAVAYSTWTGGDAWEWMNYANRFIASATPMLFVAAAWGAVGLVDQRRPGTVVRVLRATAAAMVALAVVSAAAVLPTTEWLAEAGNGAARSRAAALTLGALVLAVASVRYPPTRPGARRDLLRAALVAAVLSSSLAPLAGWMPNGGREVPSDKRTAQMGLLLGDLLEPQTTIAVVHAGNLSYFSMLPAVDLLGKNDEVVARSDPHTFYPGHGKWDFEHSIAQLRPAVIVQLADGYRAEERARLPDLGYVELPGRVWVDPERADVAAVTEAIRRAGWDGPEVSGI